MRQEIDPFASLGTLSAQLLGVVGVLAQELVRSQAVDVSRLRQELDNFWSHELDVAGLQESERRMIESVRRVIGTALAQEADDGQGH